MLPQHFQFFGSSSSTPSVKAPPAWSCRIRTPFRGDCSQDSRQVLRFFAARFRRCLQPAKGGEEPELSFSDHLQRQRQILPEELPVVQRAGGHLAEIDFSHEPRFIHLSEDPDPPQSRLIEKNGRRKRGSNPSCWAMIFKTSMILVMFISWGHLTAHVSHMAHSHKVLD